MHINHIQIKRDDNYARHTEPADDYIPSQGHCKTWQSIMSAVARMVQTLSWRDHVWSILDFEGHDRRYQLQLVEATPETVAPQSGSDCEIRSSLMALSIISKSSLPILRNPNLKLAPHAFLLVMKSNLSINGKILASSIAS